MRRLLGCLALACTVTVVGCDAPKRFEETAPPPAPDYSRSDSWLGFPGRNGLERSAPAGMIPVDETTAPADVFFVHPTTYLKNDVWNVPADAPTEYGAPVLLNQASAFNGCCRIYAPHYRQATLIALGNADKSAVDLAYSDVERAFRWYIDHENQGRPFIIASHSQGSMHAVRLLQQQILGTTLQDRLIAAYVVGSYVPTDFVRLGLPVCDSATQTGCIVAWNTAQAGRTGAYRLTRNPTYWWQGGWKHENQPPSVCVNPLLWRHDGTSPASGNLGSEALPSGGAENRPAEILPPPIAAVTGAACNDDLLDVDLSLFDSNFQGLLSIVSGSYHLVDYGLFYQNIRTNAAERTAAWYAAP